MTSRAASRTGFLRHAMLSVVVILLLMLTGQSTTAQAAPGDLVGAAYAVLDDAGNLTMFRSEEPYVAGLDQTVTDVAGNTYVGQVYTNIETSTSVAGMPSVRWYNQRESILTVDIADSQTIRPATSVSSWFSGCKNMVSCDLTGLDTGTIASASYMFKECAALTTLDLSMMDTSQVTNTSYMFYKCSNLTSLDISSFDTGNVTDMTYMFGSCNKLATLTMDTQLFKTDKVTTMRDMFYTCSNLEQLDVSQWDTSKVTSLWCTFNGCSKLAALDVSDWDTSNVTTLVGTFSGCSSIETLDVTNWNTGKVTELTETFANCKKLSSLDPSGWDTTKVTTLEDTFKGCESLTSLDLHRWNTSKVTDMFETFCGCKLLSSLILTGADGGWDTSKVTEMYSMFEQCRSLTTLDLSSFDTGCVTDMCSMFYYANHLTSLDLHNFDTSNVTALCHTFYYCESLASIDLSGWNTSKVTRMDGMFCGCYVLGTSQLQPYLSTFDTSKVVDMNFMFDNCRALTSLDLSNFVTNKVTNFRGMFRRCWNLRHLDISSFDTKAATNMGDMFCIHASHIGAESQLESVKLGENFRFKGKNITTATWMGLLPYPPSDAPYTGLWVNQDVTDAPGVTVVGLRNNYAGETTGEYARGTYVWHTAPCVTYDANGGSGTMAVVTLKGTVQASSCRFTAPVGKVFSRWNTEPDGSGDTYLVGAVLPKTADITLYAQWGNPEPDAGEAYAVLDDEGNLIFFRSFESYTSGSQAAVKDIYGNVYYGWVYWPLERAVSSGNSDMAPWKDRRSTIRTVRVATSQVVKPYDMAYWFKNCSQLTSCDLRGLDISNTISLRCTFEGCSALTMLDISSWETRGLYSMHCTFANCSSLKAIDFPSTFRTRYVDSMTMLFLNCRELTALDLSHFDTSDATQMKQMFSGCTKLSSVSLGENFSFKGDNITTQANQALLDAPAVTSIYDGKWVNVSVPGASGVTSGDLRDYYDGSQTTGDYACGTYVWHETMQLFAHLYANGGTGTMDATPVVDGAVAPECTFVPPTGMVFDSWNTAADGSGTRYAAGASLPVGSADIDLYAQWRLDPTAGKAYAILTTAADTVNGANKLIFFRSTNTTTLDGYGDGSTCTVTDIVGNSYTGRFYKGVETLSASDKDDIPWHSYSEDIVVSQVAANQVIRPVSTGFWFVDCNNMTACDLTGLDTSMVSSMDSMFKNCLRLASLDVSHFDTSQVTNMHMMFTYCASLTALDISHFDTQNVSDMSHMFSSCSSLVTLDLTNFNTSNVTSMNDMFNQCQGLNYLNVSRFDTSNVTNMHSMFQGCQGLASLDLSNFNTHNVTDMSEMFEQCTSLLSLDLSNFDTHNVAGASANPYGGMAAMFAMCSSLQEVNVSSFDTTQVSSMLMMFYQCGDLEQLDIANFSTANTQFLYYMFGECSSLASVALGEAFSFKAQAILPTPSASSPYTGYWINSDVRSAVGVTPEDLQIQYDGTVTDTSYARGTYVWERVHASFVANGGNGQMDDIYLVEGTVAPACEFSPYSFGWSFSEWNTAADGTGAAYVPDDSLPSTANLVLYAQWIWLGNTDEIIADTTAYAILTNANDATYGAGELIFFRSAERYSAGTNKTVTDIAGNTYTGQLYTGIEKTNSNNSDNCLWYRRAGEIQEAFVAQGQVIRPKNMAYWFASCNNMTKFNENTTGVFDTSDVTSMNNLFDGCSHLTALDISGFNTANVTDMSYMFSDCTRLTALDVSQFATASVTNMSAMFVNCSNLQSLDVSQFVTSSVTNMSSMFSFCSQLSTLNVSGFDTSNVTLMNNMFGGCSSLASLDVSHFETDSVTNMAGMFAACEKMTSFTGAADKFVTGNVLQMSSMFYDCLSLDSLNLSAFDTHKVMAMSFMFYQCPALSTLDVSSFDTHLVNEMAFMFADCGSLTSLNLSSFDTSNVYSMMCAFDNCKSLCSVDLGTSFSFKGANTGYIASNVNNDQGLLPTPPVDGIHTGKWINSSATSAVGVTAENLRDNYVGSSVDASYKAGTYVWDTLHAYTVMFDGNGGSGSMPVVEVETDEGYVVPTPLFTRRAYAFSGWTSSDGNPHPVDSTIAANTFAPGYTLVLTANWTAYEMSGTEDSQNLNPDGDDTDLWGDNLAFSVPTQISFILSADGTLNGPSNACIVSHDTQAMRVSGVKVEAQNGFNLVESVGGDSSNQIALRFGAGTSSTDATLNLHDYLDKGDLSGDSWLLPTENSSVSLAFAGEAGRVSADIRTATGFARMTWYVTATPAQISAV